MRNQLTQFEGQLVVIEGRMTRRITRPDGLLDICLAAIKVRPLRSDMPMDDIEPVTVDHAWLQGLEPDLVQKAGLLQKYHGLAKVSYYRRSNGTMDLGFQSKPSVNVEQVVTDANNMEFGLRTGYLNYQIRRIESGVPAWGCYIAGDDALKVIRRIAKRNEKTLVLNFGTHYTATNNGPCRKIDVLRKVKQPQRTSQGFA